MMSMSGPHQNFPFDLAFFDDICLIQSFLCWLQNNFSTSSILSMFIRWLLTFCHKQDVLHLIYRFIIGVDS